jgi:hypothetical protein
MNQVVPGANNAELPPTTKHYPTVERLMDQKKNNAAIEGAVRSTKIGNSYANAVASGLTSYEKMSKPYVDAAKNLAGKFQKTETIELKDDE